MELCGTAGEPGAQLWGAHGGAGTTPSKESPVLSSPSGSEGCPSEPPLPLHHRLHWVLRHNEGIIRRRVGAWLSCSAANSQHVS